MDYNRNECQAVLENSQDNLFNLRPSTGIAFFEAICLRGRCRELKPNLLSSLIAMDTSLFARGGRWSLPKLGSVHIVIRIAYNNSLEFRRIQSGYLQQLAIFALVMDIIRRPYCMYRGICSGIHVRTISLRFLGIILRVIRLEVSVWIS